MQYDIREMPGLHRFPNEKLGMVDSPKVNIPEPDRRLEVDDQLERLCEAAIRLENSVGMLLGRLGSISRISEPCQPEGKEISCVTSLGERLQMLRLRIYQVDGALLDAIDRLEI